MRPIVAFEITTIACQQITALSRFGFQDAFFQRGNIMKHLVGVLDPAEALSLPTKIDSKGNRGGDKQRDGNGKRADHRPRSP